ncbi:hypothetical protein ACHHYP_20363 [Achlya hypogyna]|uniref:Uncharacterized protein n=1 Tax=Achlya hypogyna TaxID=1202772 RepID=A0A1V9YPR4_ACHHY|nr:hypothetical protein ACHHYP_20363 [Achlya hypogyna]
MGELVDEGQESSSEWVDISIEDAVAAISMAQSGGRAKALTGPLVVPRADPWPQKTWGVDIQSLLAIAGRATLAVPIDFAVPALSLWPPQWHGYALGSLAWDVGLHLSSLPVDCKAELDALGFVFSTDATWANVVESLAVFQKLHSHCRVSATFVVPSEEEAWPAALGGLPLGAL